MAELAGKRFENSDEVREFVGGTGRVELVDLNGHAVVAEPSSPAGDGRSTSSLSRVPTRARSSTSAMCSRVAWR
jgi:hypothetical protein